MLGCALSLCVSASAADVPDKSRYTLLNPTPREQMRELSADRPDKTESPFTVDAGHYQVEMDLFNMSIDRHNPEHARIDYTAWEAANITLKAGVLNNLDAQLAFVSYRYERVADRTQRTVERNRGFGDITPRLKWNVWGNDGGRTSLALLPFVKLPTGRRGLSNHEVEGGLKIPFAIEVPGVDLCLMTEVDFLHDDTGGGYYPEFVNSIAVGRNIIGDLGLAAEFFSAVNTESDHWDGSVDVWFTYDANENLRFDAGVYIGVTRASEDWHPFVGLTWRH